MVKKIEDTTARSDRIHECEGHTDGQTDGRTPHDSIGPACVASRAKKYTTQET